MIETNTSNIESLQSSVGEVSSVATTNSGNITAINKTLGEQGAAITKAQTDIADNKTEINKKATITALNQEISDRSSGDSALDAKITTNAGAIATINTSLTTLDGSVSANTSSIATINENISDLQGHVANTTIHVTATDKTNWNAKAPKSHSSTSNEYGQGNANNFGHVKLSDSASTTGASSGIAVTPKALNDAISTLSEEISDGDIAVLNNLKAHIGTTNASDLYRQHITYADAVDHDNTTLPIDADTVGGMTLDQIKSYVSGTSQAAGTVGFSTANTTTGTTVTLTNVSNGNALMPRTTADNVSGLDAKINASVTSGTATAVKFVISTSEPTGAIGVIWFQPPSSGNKHTIKIYNGSTWEVMNSWQ